MASISGAPKWFPVLRSVTKPFLHRKSAQPCLRTLSSQTSLSNSCPSRISASRFPATQQSSSFNSIIRQHFSTSTQEFSTASASVDKAFENVKAAKIDVAPKLVGYWLVGCASLTVAIIIVGGVTRLTESGLSITEWQPFKGTKPPITPEEWAIEYAKYRDSEEGKILNANITLEDFKRIFYMEWGHRVLGRLLGVVFVVPAAYFGLSGKLPGSLKWKALAIAGGIGFQGFLGWYMVASGLDKEHLAARPDSTPRVSQYRLAAHLGAAFVLYAGMCHTAAAIFRDASFAKGKLLSRPESLPLLNSNTVKWFRRSTWGIAAMVLITALSGAFVAGLDAGLIYNEFPEMGENYIPPFDELYNVKRYSRNDNGTDGWWRNWFENPTAVQFDHRVLAMTSFSLVVALATAARLPSIKRSLPRSTPRYAAMALGAACLQVTLGIATLLYLVPTELAASHQAGSVLLLTTMIATGASLRRPSSQARIVRTLNGVVPK